MQTIQVTGDITQVVRLKMVNAYLVRDDDGLTLIDTMISGSAKDLLSAARGLGAPIVRITLTHAHPDHLGSLDAIREQVPEAEVALFEREAALMAGDRTQRPGEAAPIKGNFGKVKTRPTRTLAAGDRLGALEVVPAPGHTPGQVAFLDTRSNTLIAGDAFKTLGGLNHTGTVDLKFPFPGLATWHKPTALRTAQALRDLKPAILAVGHGAPLRDPGAQLDRLLAG